MVKLVQNKQGNTIIELILSIAIFGLLVVPVLQSSLFFKSNLVTYTNRNKAVQIAKQNLEAARNIRDESYDNLPTGQSGVIVLGGDWDLFSDSTQIDNFISYIEVEEVEENVKKVTSTVYWSKGNQREEISLTTYLTNWRREESVGGPPGNDNGPPGNGGPPDGAGPPS